MTGVLKAIIFDVDGTLVDSVDLHAAAWQRALQKFGHEVSFVDARGQIGKGGDKLIPFFLSEAEQADHGEAMEKYRGELFRSDYLHLVRPFTAVPALMQRLKEAGLKIAVASSAKQKELDVYLEVAGIADMIDANTCSDDVGDSKPDPDIFEAALEKLGCGADEAVVIGDTPYDAIAATKAGIKAVGVLSGGFREEDLREAGCVAVYPGPGALWTCFENSPLNPKRAE